MGRLGKQPALVIELQEQEKSLVIIPTSSSIEWIDWLVSHRSINTEIFTRERVDEAFSLICMMFRYILLGPGLLVYMSILLWLFLVYFRLKRKIWRKGSEWQDNRYWVHHEMTLSSPTFDVLDFEKPWPVGWRKNNSSRAKEDLTSVGDSSSWTALLEGS